MIIKCRPNRVAQTYLGGHRINRLRRLEREDGFFSEEWVASVTSARNVGSSDPNDGLSLPESGKTLLSLLDEHPEYLGKCERLVIQAHPTAEFAKEHLNSPFGKAECWYVLSADEGAHVYIGFRESVTSEEWVKAFDV